MHCCIIGCHYQDCKALLISSLTYVSSVYLCINPGSLVHPPCLLGQQVEMEDTSMDAMEEKSDNNGNGADTESQDDEDDIDPPVTQ